MLGCWAEAGAQTLFRVRPQSSVYGTVGATFAVPIFVDHTSATADVDATITGLAFAFTIPDEHELIEVSFADTVFDEIDAPPELWTKQWQEAGVAYVAVLPQLVDPNFSLPPSLSDVVARVHLAASTDADLFGPYPFEILDEVAINGVGTPIRTELWTTAARVSPARGAGTIDVLPAGTLIAEAAPDFPTPGADDYGFTIIEDDLPSMDASGVGAGQSLAGEGGGGAPAGGPGGGVCDIDPTSTLPVGAVLGGAPVQPTIDTVLGFGGLAADAAIVLDSPGSYGTIEVDMALLNGFTLTIYTEGVSGADVVIAPPIPTGPAIEITDSGGGTGTLRIGFIENELDQPVPPATYPATWHGMTIDADGTSPLLGSSGILIGPDVGGRIEIVGNIIQDGGVSGVSINGGEDVLLAQNEIRNSFGAERGGGVFVADSNVTMYKNWVHGNGLSNTMRQTGGGVGAIMTGAFVDRDEVALCGNWIYENQAFHGGGVWLGVEDAASASYHVEENDVRSNSFTPVIVTPPPLVADFGLLGYFGGGIMVVNARENFIGDLQLGLYNNFVHENVISGASTGGFIDDERGGGIYLGCLITEGPADFIGNAITTNEAVSHGGGLYLGAWTSLAIVDGLEYHNNTVSFNAIAGPSPIGAGLFVPFDPSLEYPEITARSVVLSNNEIATLEWFAECSGSPSVLPTSTWDYSQMQNILYAGCGPGTPDSQDLFATGVSNDAASPNLLLTGQFPNLRMGSPCINTGDPAATLPVSVDFEGDPRVVEALIDRGADEAIELPFLRGDVNEDGSVNIADAFVLANILFVPGSSPPPCMDAADANDDGLVDVTDVNVIANLTPAPPFPNCGLDPTADTLPTCLGVTPSCP